MVQAMAWPIVVVVVVLGFFLLFREQLGAYIGRAGSVTVSAGPVKIQARVVAMLTAATAQPADGGEAKRRTPSAVMTQVDDIAEVANRVVTPGVIRRLTNAVVLWVDDRPQNNVYERAALDALGVRFEISTNTDEALRMIKSRTKPFDAIISDMGRPPDSRAGYTLLDALRKSGNRTPYIIDAGSNLPEHKAMALERGAQGSTNRPEELFQLVVSAIQAAN